MANVNKNSHGNLQIRSSSSNHQIVEHTLDQAYGKLVNQIDDYNGK